MVRVVFQELSPDDIHSQEHHPEECHAVITLRLDCLSEPLCGHLVVIGGHLVVILGSFWDHV